jgi:hypothetical protein
MVQGSTKFQRAAKPVKAHNSAKITKQVMKAKKKARKGNPLAMPSASSNFHEEADLDRRLTQAINKSNEQKIAAKVIQAGQKMGTSDLTQRGKELSKAQRRAQVKRKVSRVEEKLNSLKAAAEKAGKI